MTYLDLIRDADRQIDDGRITIGEYEQMIIPLNQEIQPERKRGEWIRYGEDGEPNDVDTVFWQCDQCLNTETGRRDKPMDFCPNCGADMRKENES